MPADPEALRETHRRMLGLILGEEPGGPPADGADPSILSALIELRSAVARIKASIVGGASETSRPPAIGNETLCNTNIRARGSQSNTITT